MVTFGCVWRAWPRRCATSSSTSMADRSGRGAARRDGEPSTPATSGRPRRRSSRSRPGRAPTDSHLVDEADEGRVGVLDDRAEVLADPLAESERDDAWRCAVRRRASASSTMAPRSARRRASRGPSFDLRTVTDDDSPLERLEDSRSSRARAWSGVSPRSVTPRSSPPADLVRARVVEAYNAPPETTTTARRRRRRRSSWSATVNADSRRRSARFPALQARYRLHDLRPGGWSRSARPARPARSGSSEGSRAISPSESRSSEPVEP